MTKCCALADILNTTFSLITSFQRTSGLENSLGYVFWPKKFNNDIEIALTLTGFEL